MDYAKTNKSFFSRCDSFATSFAAIILLMVWSFFEASFWFIAPDFLIFILSFFAPKKYKKFIYVALLASLFGGITYYFLNLYYSDVMISILHRTFFVPEKNIKFVASLFSNYGVCGAFFQSFTLIPFKIWTSLVVSNGFNAVAYFSIVIISRLIRFFTVGAIALFIRKMFNKFSEKNIISLFLLYIVLFFWLMFLLES